MTYSSHCEDKTQQIVSPLNTVHLIDKVIRGDITEFRLDEFNETEAIESNELHKDWPLYNCIPFLI